MQLDAHPYDIHRKLLALDTVTLAAHLTVIVTDNDTYKELVGRRGQEAQSLLDLLQDVCIYSNWVLFLVLIYTADGYRYLPQV